ncbi:FadR/GntR family transcriptional regulator [Ancylomarina sp. 16SWW S1-10-2]|uniref:FadR/GntR family transcriptional regulator n=1 Tax=Ancylomarina sp. 16SWW S1-10-2 TaxID=2499681 RepID=UPI0012AE67B1|nr:FadR/GntR family transcriptional regulator [Ancylomarina sp. 16SWW S1-10-2]MRT94284.1 FadR family transcriptional regulator [Ancylomarina sp. 16SWW S1-10-2]
MDLLDNFKTIEVVTPVDKIIRQIRGLIVSGYLNPGDKLPSERKLSEKLGVGRTYIRDAIKKLEFFGVLTTLPQSGVIVNGIDISAMEGLFSNIMKIERPDFFSLVETRVTMEVFSMRCAAERRTEDDLIELEKALEAYEEKAKKHLPAENEDFLFHLKIAEAGHNAVIKAMMLIILPDILAIYRQEHVCQKDVTEGNSNEHRDILNAIKEQDGEKAALLMENHLQNVLDFSKRML